MKYAWIASNKKHRPVSLSCDLLSVSASGFFEHMRRKGTDKPSKPGPNKRISNQALLAHLLAIHAEVKQEYGWPKMWKELVARVTATEDRIIEELRGTSNRGEGSHPLQSARAIRPCLSIRR